MTSSRVAYVAGLILSLITGSAASGGEHDWRVQLDAVARQHITEERAVGMIIGVIKDGKTWVGSYGQARRNDPAAPARHSIFEIGSITKVFTGIALGQMVLDGKVRLEDPIKKHLPELCDSPAGRITLRELTTHTSGLPRLPSNMKPADPTNPYADYREEDLLRFLRDFKFAQHGPYPVVYSNVGTALLGYVLSRVDGSNYDSLIRKIVAGPLKMHDTRVVLSSSQLPRFVNGHEQDLEESPHWDLPLLAGGGGLRSTAQDMLKFLAANLDPEKSPLAGAIQLSHQTQVEEKESRIGLGWFFEGAKDNPVIWHDGQTGGFHSLIAFKPKERIGIIMLSNTAASVECISAVVFGKSCQLKKEFSQSPAQLESFAGKYQLGSGALIAIKRVGPTLALRITGQSGLRLTSVGEGKFEVSVGGGIVTVDFVRGADGGVERFILTQNGIRHPAERTGR